MRIGAYTTGFLSQEAALARLVEVLKELSIDEENTQYLIGVNSWGQYFPMVLIQADQVSQTHLVLAAKGVLVKLIGAEA